MKGILLIALLIILIAVSSRGRTTTKRIEDVAPGTMLVHRVDGSKREHEYGGGTDDYYHEEAAADYLSSESCTAVEIKDESGKVYRYNRESLRRAGWL